MDNERPYRPASVEPDAIMTFFRERQTKEDCPHCSQRNWQIFEGVDDRGVALPIFTAAGAPSMQYVVPLLLLICQNCGYAWLMSRKLYENWLAERKAQ